jgi:hypothetical protein
MILQVTNTHVNTTGNAQCFRWSKSVKPLLVTYPTKRIRHKQKRTDTQVSDFAQETCIVLFHSVFSSSNKLSEIALHVSESWCSNLGPDSPSRGTDSIPSHRSTVKFLRRLKLQVFTSFVALSTGMTRLLIGYTLEDLGWAPICAFFIAFGF